MSDRDPEVPEADAIEQQQTVDDPPRVGRPSPDPEVPADDALEQAHEVGYDDEQ